MGVSIITISNNRAELLKTLHSVFSKVDEIESVVGDEWEYIVVEVSNYPLESFPVKHIKVRKGGFSLQRNIGVKNSRFDNLLFIDDGMEVGSGWFKHITTPIFSGECDAVLGAVLPQLTDERNLDDMYRNILALSQSFLGFPGGGLKYYSQGRRKIDSFSTSNLAIRKELVLGVGGFDEELTFGAEDSDLSIRVKKSYPDAVFLYEPKAWVLASPRTSLGDISRWFARRGRSFAQLVRKHRGVGMSHLLSRELILPKIFVSSVFPPLLSFYLALYWSEIHKNMLGILKKLRDSFKESYSEELLPESLWKALTPQYIFSLSVFLPLLKLVMDISFSYGFYSLYLKFLFFELL